MKTKLTILMIIAGFISAEAQNWTWSEDHLSYAREGLSATVLDDSIFYSGGRLWDLSFVNIIDIYDVGADTFSTVQLETPGRQVSSTVSAGGKVFIAGGENLPVGQYFDEIDVYDKATGEWTVDSLSVPRAYMGSVSAGNKVFFAGGGKLTSTGIIYYSVVDIYDTETNEWSVAELTIPRALTAAAAAGSKVFFAGGETGLNEVTDIVDIYDLSTGTWSMKFLSEARSYTAAVSYGNKVYFAGGTLPFGNTSLVIDIYNVDTNDWEDPIYLESSRIVTALNVYNALVFTGHVDFIDISNHTWGPPNGIVEIYYPETGQWDYEVEDLNPSRMWYARVAYDNRAYYAGGWPSGGNSLTNSISILDFSTGIAEDNFENLETLIFPNPFTSTFHIDYNLKQSCNVSILIYNQLGQKVEMVLDEFKQQGEQQVIFNSEKLKPGIYFCVLKTDDPVYSGQTKKMIKL